MIDFLTRLTFYITVGYVALTVFYQIKNPPMYYCTQVGATGAVAFQCKVMPYVKTVKTIAMPGVSGDVSGVPVR
jgi:hypothetical protein